MVYRVYVEKKEALANEARALLEDLREFLGIRSLTGIRLLNRYDLENINRELFDYAVKTVLSEPQLDTVSYDPPEGSAVFAVEYLPGQYDQREKTPGSSPWNISPVNMISGRIPPHSASRYCRRGNAPLCVQRGCMFWKAR